MSGVRVPPPALPDHRRGWTFLRRALDAYETAGISNREELDRVGDKVAGIDPHPVAVTLARVTYLLAIGRERMSGERGPLTIPVFLGDSVRWEQDPTLLARSGITIRTSDEMKLIDQERAEVEPASKERRPM